MTSPNRSPLQGGSRRRHYRRRGPRRRRSLRTFLAILLPVAGVAAAWFLLADNGSTVGGGNDSQATARSPAVTKAPAPGLCSEILGVSRHLLTAPYHSNLKHPRQLIYRHILTDHHHLSRNFLFGMKAEKKPDHFHVYTTQSVHVRWADSKSPLL